MILLEIFNFSLLFGIMMVDGFLSLEIVDSGCWIHHFDCASNIHTRVYFHLTLRSPVVVGLYGYPWSWLQRCLIDVDRWLIDIDRCLVDINRFFIVHQISILQHIPFSSMRFFWAMERGWMISVGCLPYGFDIKYYTRAYFLLFFKVFLRLRQLPDWFQI